MGDFSGLTDRAAADSGLAAYHWDIAQDVISWSPWSAQVLGCDPETVSTGREFATLLDPDNLTSRYDTVMGGGEHDVGGGVPFRIEYRFMPQGRTSRASQ